MLYFYSGYYKTIIPNKFTIKYYWNICTSKKLTRFIHKLYVQTTTNLDYSILE